MLRMRVSRPFLEQICLKPAFWALHFKGSQNALKFLLKFPLFYSVFWLGPPWFCRTRGLYTQNAGFEAIFWAKVLKTRILSSQIH